MGRVSNLRSVVLLVKNRRTLTLSKDYPVTQFRGRSAPQREYKRGSELEYSFLGPADEALGPMDVYCHGDEQ